MNKHAAMPKSAWVFPALSVAVQLTAVLPSEKVEPDAGEQSGVTLLSTMSVAEAV